MPSAPPDHRQPHEQPRRLLLCARSCDGATRNYQISSRRGHEELQASGSPSQELDLGTVTTTSTRRPGRAMRSLQWVHESHELVAGSHPDLVLALASAGHAIAYEGRLPLPQVRSVYAIGSCEMCNAQCSTEECSVQKEAVVCLAYHQEEEAVFSASASGSLCLTYKDGSEDQVSACS